MIDKNEGIAQIAVQPQSQDKEMAAQHSFRVSGGKSHQQAVRVQQSIQFDGDKSESESNKNQRINAENGNLSQETAVLQPFKQTSANNEAADYIIPYEQSPEEKVKKQNQNHKTEQNSQTAINQEKIFENKQFQSKLEQVPEAPSVMESNKIIESKFISEKAINNDERNPSNIQITLTKVYHNTMKNESNINYHESASPKLRKKAQKNLLIQPNQEQTKQRQGYRLNSQFVESIQEQKQKKIVQFDEFPQSQRIKQSNSIPQVQDHQNISRQQQQIGPKHTNEFSFSQKKQQRPVQKHIFNGNSPSRKKQESPKQGVGKIAKKVLHQKKIHDVIVNLQRNDPKKIMIPMLQQTTKLSKQPDFSKLTTNITLNSNIISLTIGQLISKEDNEALRLLDEIEHLKRKLQSIEGSIKRKDQLNQQQNAYKQAKFESIQEQALANKHNGRQNLGQIYQRIEFNNSKLSQQLQGAGITSRKRLRLNQSQTVRSAPKPRLSPFSDAFQNSIGNFGPNETQKRGETTQFRVRKNKTALPGQGNYKQAGFIRHQKKPSEKDKCFQTRKVALQKLQFTYDEKMILIQKPKPRELTFNEDFDQYVDNYFFDVGNQAPRKDWNQQELVQIAKVTYKKFGVNLQNQKQTLHVKKYKNCVSFILDSLRTIIWYYEGKLYYGGWEVKDSGDGEKNGWGYQYTPKKFQYSGFFKDNKRDGYGIMKFLTRLNDLIYQGLWKDGLKNGRGKQKQADKSVYVGEWLDGKKSGQGKLVASEKQVYEGSFLNGLKNGEGRETFASGDTYEGNYRQGQFHGFGIYAWANFSRYEGQFREGSRNGQGIWVSDYRDKNSDHYEGHYKDDKKSGFGLYCWKDGTKYQGYFLNDLKHRQGVVSYPDGNSARLQWLEGNIVSQQKTIQGQKTSNNNNEHGLGAEQSRKSAPKPSMAKFNIKNSSRPKASNQR